MKNLIIPILIALSFQAFSQSKFAVGLVGSVDRCRLSNGFGEASSISEFYTQSALGYQGGLRLRYDATGIFSIHSGFTLVSHTIKSEKISLNYGSYQSSSYPQAYQQEETFKAFQVPLLFSFYFGHTLKFGFTIGPAYNYIYRDDLKLYAYLASETRELNYSYKLTSENQFLSASAGLGVEYNLPHWAFRIEPTATSQVLFFDNKRANENYRLWSAGLAFSGLYRF